MPSDVAKRIAENIETHREIMRSNGAKENPAVIQAIIDAELKAEREAAERMQRALVDAGAEIDALLVFSHQYTQTPMHRAIAVLKRLPDVISAYRKATGRE